MKRDVVAKSMKEAGFNEVELEPQLQPLSGESTSLQIKKQMQEAI